MKPNTALAYRFDSEAALRGFGSACPLNGKKTGLPPGASPAFLYIRCRKAPID